MIRCRRVWVSWDQLRLRELRLGREQREHLLVETLCRCFAILFSSLDSDGSQSQLLRGHKRCPRAHKWVNDMLSRVAQAEAPLHHCERLLRRGEAVLFFRAHWLLQH